MKSPRPSAESFARDVVRAELARTTRGADPTVAEHIMVPLHRELGRLLGSAGLDVLLARALVVARRSHPSLARVTAGAGGTLAGLERDEAAATAIVAHFIELLATLVGEDLAMRLVRDSWPSLEREEKEK